jgi:hypothetical protein
MSITFPTTNLKVPSGITALPSGMKRPAFGTLYGFDAQGGDAGGGGIENEYSVDFDGANDYCAIGSSHDLGTLSLWFKSDSVISSTSAAMNVIGFTGVAPYSTGGISFGSIAGAVTNELITIYTGNWIYAYSSASATISTDWHHLAVRWSGSDYEIYLDGTNLKNDDGQYGSGAKAYVPISSFNIGRRNVGDKYFGGLIDEVAIWSTPLSEADTLALYPASEVPTDLTALSPVGWWRMGDNDTGTTITDQGSGSNDGTLTNGPTYSSDVPS